MDNTIQSDYRLQGSDRLNFISHNDRSIEFIQTWSEGGYFIVKNHIFPISPGSLIIINAIDNHHSNPINPETYIRSKLIIPYEMFTDLVILLGISDFANENIIKKGGISYAFENSIVKMKIDSYMQDAYYACKNNDPNCKACVITSVINILMQVLNNHDRQVEYKNRRTIDQLADYINLHSNNWDSVSLENICDNLNISQSRAAHLFKELTGDTITNYRNQLIISEAKKQLLSSSLKIYEISKMLDFEECTIFNRYFKKAVGCTPKEYRISGGILTENQSKRQQKKSVG